MSDTGNTADAWSGGAGIRATTGTRWLLAFGVAAGPLYLLVGLIQALTRNGFDLARHDLSVLANGDLGWIQITNLLASGLMATAAAVGMRRVLRPGNGAVWGPRLVGIYGIGVAAAGLFVADPTNGFPPGTQAGPGPTSWHGLLHFVCGGIGFLALIAGCFVMAGWFAAHDERGWAVYSRVTGVIFFVAFIGIASGSGNPVTVLGFLAAVAVAWAWISVLSAHLLRQAAGLPSRPSREPRVTV